MIADLATVAQSSRWMSSVSPSVASRSRWGRGRFTGTVTAAGPDVRLSSSGRGQ